MGSFNVSCGISNLSINEGDKIGLVLLSAISEYEGMSRARGSQDLARTMRIYNTDDYKVFLPPVFGTYDDYGNIANVEKSITTALIEEMFHHPVETVLNSIGGFGDLYGSSGKAAELYMERRLVNALNAWSAADTTIFEAAGFKVTKPETGYIASYEHQGYRLQQRVFAEASKVMPYTTHAWKLDDGKKTLFDDLKTVGNDEAARALEAFSATTKLLPGFDKKDWAAVKTLSSLGGMFFLKEVYEEMDAFVQSNPYDRADTERIESELETFLQSTTSFTTKLGLGLPSRYVENYTPHKSDSKLLPRYAGSKEFATIMRLIVVLFRTNRMLAPTFNGEQFGNDDAARELNKVTGQILDDRKSDSEEDED